MTPQTMSEKDAYLATFEREYEISKKVLNAYPADQLDLKPSEKSKAARDLAWMLVLNQMVVVPVVEGAELEPGSFPKSPQTLPEILAAFEQAHRETVAKVKSSQDAVWSQSMKIPTGPKLVGDIRRGDAVWFFLHDTIHHRGQLSVYLRIAGGKLPSIYGPTADEPWW